MGKKCPGRLSGSACGPGKGMTIRDVLKSAFDPLLQKEQRMNEICDMLGSADPEEMDALMEELGNIQDELTL